MGLEEMIGGICAAILLLGLLYVIFEPKNNERNK